MPYSCDPLSRDIDGKSITTEFLFPYLRYFEFMCAKRLRGRLYFVIRLLKIQIKVAHAISLFICIGIGCSILYYRIPRKW